MVITVEFDYNPDAYFNGQLVPIALYIDNNKFLWKGSLNYKEEPNLPEIKIPSGSRPHNKMTREEWLALQPSDYTKSLVIPLITFLEDYPSDMVIYCTSEDQTMFSQILYVIRKEKNSIPGGKHHDGSICIL